MIVVSSLIPIVQNGSMSRTFTLISDTSVLSANFYPPIELEKSKSYGVGLLGFYSYNSIFNIDERNNRVGFVSKNTKAQNAVISRYVVKIPPGAYEINEINMAIKRGLAKVIDDNNDQLFNLQANNNTLKCEVMSSTFDIDFGLRHSVGPVLGFETKKPLAANIKHESSSPVNITKVRLIRIDCNIVTGAYLNEDEQHTLFEFDIDVEAGYKLTKEPTNIIYMPVHPSGRQFIDNITIRILDDNGHLINFRGEKVIVKVELKKLS